METSSIDIPEARLQVTGARNSCHDSAEAGTPISTESQPLASESPAEVLHVKNSSQPKPPPGYVEDPEYLERNLIQVKDDLAKVSSKAKADLERKNQEINEIRQQANVVLQEKEQERDDYYKRWKQATSELNKILAQSQGFQQVTDQELIQRATQLRYNIRNFADEHFVDEVKDKKGVRSFYASAKRYLKVSPKILDTFMSSPSKDPIVVKAYLWAFIAENIFGKFCWAGPETSRAMSHLTLTLTAEPGDDGYASSPDAKRIFQTWRANTTNLLISADNLDGDDGHGAHQGNNQETVQEILHTLRPFSQLSDRDLADEVSNIVLEALVLDKMISRQVAEVTWLFDSEQTSTLDSDDKRASDVHNVWLVVAPGMTKRGKSTGADFSLGSVLLEREIWYDPGTYDGPEENYRGITGSFINRAKGVVKNSRK
ncbi:MAG: hypothetical protein Q9221_002239 [Calogaya cf. arnoldii]